MGLRVTRQNVDVLSEATGGKLRVTRFYVEVLGKPGAESGAVSTLALQNVAAAHIDRSVSAGNTLTLSDAAKFDDGQNPFALVFSHIAGSNEVGPISTLHLVCAFGQYSYNGLARGNPYSEVKRILLECGGRSAGYREIESLLSSLENSWATRLVR